MNNLYKPQSRQDLRDWLKENAASAKDCWIVIDRDQSNLTYLDIVEEALCFGWIDSTKRSFRNGIAQWLSPRTKRANGPS